jgi:hypothetical protein
MTRSLLIEMTVAAALPGDTPATAKYDHPLQKLWAQVVDTPGIYTQGMLISQLQNIQRMVGQADQKMGKTPTIALATCRPSSRGCRRSSRRSPNSRAPSRFEWNAG